MRNIWKRRRLVRDYLLIIFSMGHVLETVQIIDFSSFAARTVRIVLAVLAVCRVVVVRTVVVRTVVVHTVAVAGNTEVDHIVAAGHIAVHMVAVGQTGFAHMDSDCIDYSAEVEPARPICS